ncbi:MAG: Membrane-bound metal-dependent hydrolase [uncultured bacterium]|nr:MAG: Membrane-bound metal-dependent hydrolase [uncultured bacterium]
MRLSKQAGDIALITVASIIPDVDALGAIIDVMNGGEAEYFTSYHHKFGHCFLFCLLLLPAVYWFSRKNLRLTAWFAGVFHLHLICDVIGARGPDGYQWPVYYLWPFSDTGITWAGQWHINAWPNILLTCLLLFDFLRQAASVGFTPLRLVSRGADNVLVDTLQKRFGRHHEP